MSSTTTPQRISDLRVGQLIKFLGVAFLMVWCFLCMWWGQVLFEVLAVEKWHLTYDATGIKGIDLLAGRFLMFVPTMFTSAFPCYLILTNAYPSKANA